MLIQKHKTKEIINNHHNDTAASFERKIENATEGLSHNCFIWLERVANENNNNDNVIPIANYVMVLKIQINLPDSYGKVVIILLSKFSIFSRIKNHRNP